MRFGHNRSYEPDVDLAASLLGDRVSLAVGPSTWFGVTHHRLAITAAAAERRIHLTERKWTASPEVSVVVALEVVSVTWFTIEKPQEGHRYTHNPREYTEGIPYVNRALNLSLPRSLTFTITTETVVAIDAPGCGPSLGGSMSEMEGGHQIVGRSPAEDTEMGSRLREVRRSRHRTLREVAEAAGISESFLSQVERAKVSASVATLRRSPWSSVSRLATSFKSSVKATHRVAGRKPTGAYFWRLWPQIPPSHGAGTGVRSLMGEFDPGGSTGDEPYSHGDSEEFMLIVEGAVQFQLGGEIISLGADDFMVYRSSVPHRLVADPSWVLGCSGSLVRRASEPDRAMFTLTTTRDNSLFTITTETVVSIDSLGRCAPT